MWPLHNPRVNGERSADAIVMSLEFSSLLFFSHDTDFLFFFSILALRFNSSVANPYTRIFLSYICHDVL